MDQDHIRLALLEHVAHAGKHAGSDIVQVLPLLHDIQVIIRLHIEDAQHLIQHLPMLPSHAHDRLKFLRILLELFHQRAHLNGLRAGSENEHYCFHYGVRFCFSRGLLGRGNTGLYLQIKLILSQELPNTLGIDTHQMSLEYYRHS